MNVILNPVKIIWMMMWAAIASILLFIPITVSALLSKTGNLAFTLSKIWARIMLGVTFVSSEILNSARIIKGQSYVIISNHQSHFDILALVTTLGVQFRWVIKKEILKIPLFGVALYASRNIFIDRSNTASAVESINRGLNRLPGGASVMIFAEGTRSRDGEIHEFKKGGFMMALTKKMPILPVTVNGSRKVLPRGSFAVNPGRIQVVVGEPIDTSGFSGDNVQALIDKTRKAIIENFNPSY